MLGTPAVTSATDLDHVAVAVERWEEAWPRYGGDLAGSWLSHGEGPGFAPAQIGYANGMKVEVLRPHRVDSNDFLRRFLDGNGPGVHHLTFKLASLTDALARAEKAGYRPVGIDRRERDWQEAFLHPRDIPGVVVQIVETTASMWSTPAPDSWPEPRVTSPARLDHVAHAVGDLDDGLRLFAGLLDGTETARGTWDDTQWVELAWPGPGRVRLLAPHRATGGAWSLASWLDGRPGRVHHLAFTCDRPAEVADAVACGEGCWEIRPEANHGVRLILRAG